MRNSKLDYSIVVLVGIVFVYAMIALFRLGSQSSPQTIWECEEKGKEIVFDFGEERDIAAIVYYLGNYGNRGFETESAVDEPIRWRTMEDLVMVQPYQWKTVPLNTNGRYLRLTTKNIYTQIGEVLFIDRAGNQILPVNAGQYPELFDETELYMGKSSYETGTVFDEPVYARTAYEYLNGMRPFEDTHPPLGKLLLMPGIAMFGMNPFGWRFMGVAASVMLLAVVGWFSRKLFSNPWISAAVTGLLACDFMVFTHSRLAQVDTFLVLFITGVFTQLFFFCTFLVNKNGVLEISKSIRYLLGSGVCFGLAIGCKWSGAYVLPEVLLIIVFCVCTAVQKGRISKKQAADLGFWTFLSYGIIPVTIYILSYIPYIPVDQELGFWEGMIQNQINMFRYHTQLETVNPESAKWFQWPLMASPITYCNLERNGLKECVYLLGNPVFWLTGLGGFFYCFYQAWETKDKRAAFLITMYLAPLLPWILVPRSSFLYHYFPCLPALALMLGYFGDKMKRNSCCLYIAAAASFLVFILFYPILAGLPISAEYVDWLEWMPWWDFS